MEIWTTEGDKENGYRWDKKPFQRFPLPEEQNLAWVLLEHWKQNDTHHYIVFSNEEASQIERLGAPLAAFRADGVLTRLVLWPMRDNYRAPAQVTYIAADTPNHVWGKSPMQLCIEFNRPGH